MTPTQELRFLILAAQRAGGRMITAGLKPLALTPAQAEVLQVLDEFQPLSLAELGGLLICESGSPSRLVAGLVKRGLVARSTSSRDARVAELSLSEAGRQLSGRLREIDDHLAGKIAASLSPKEAQALVEGLRKLLCDTPPGQTVARRRTRAA